MDTVGIASRTCFNTCEFRSIFRFTTVVIYKVYFEHINHKIKNYMGGDLVVCDEPRKSLSHSKQN